MNIATVPAFAPVHEYADWYRAFWEPGMSDVILHPPVPLPEVVAFHQEHFPEVRDFDDFIPRLTFDRWDADAVAQLAVDAGMGYLVPVTKHHDGFCWWDSPLTSRTSVRQGAHRDVITELADVARAHDLVFGLLPLAARLGAPRPPRSRAVRRRIPPPAAAGPDRTVPSRSCSGATGTGAIGAWWRADAIVEEYYAAMAAVGLDGCVNDRFNATHADYAVYEYDVPEDRPTGPWELCRGLVVLLLLQPGRARRRPPERAELVAMLTEVVAKGGNLLLNVGPKADGSIPEIQTRVLREAGAWVNANADAIHGSQPHWEWGDAETRYTAAPTGPCSRST